MSDHPRRRFLQQTFAATAGLALAATWTACSREEAAAPDSQTPTGPLPAGARFILDHYPYLKISPQDAALYAAEWDRTYGPPQEFTAEYATVFLLSTDFFQNGADESRPLRFLMIYHPFFSTCYNPLARLDEDDQA